MARIRTIKPEFPQSESMGRVSRDARLLFVMLWTICDDHGRARAHSRMLASLLFPYDDDAGEGIKVWLSELENEGCISLYEVSGSQYLQINNWSKHQKIDKPSKPQFPEPEDITRERSMETRERSSEEGTKEGTKEGKELLPHADACSGTFAVERTGTDLLGAAVEQTGKRLVIPVERVVALYHELCPRNARCEKLTSKRRGHIQARWRSDLPTLDAWRNFFTEVSQSQFLTGRVPPKPPRTTPFVADIDWLINENNFVKVLEGKFS